MRGAAGGATEEFGGIAVWLASLGRRGAKVNLLQSLEFGGTTVRDWMRASQPTNWQSVESNESQQ